MMIDDGLLEFVVEEAGDGWVRAAAVNDGLLGARPARPGAPV
jgi:pyruvate kinase